MHKYNKGNPKNINSCHKQNAGLLDVYIRNNKKQALLVHINRNTQLEHLSRAVQARFQIPIDHQLLFHNGRALKNKNTHKLEDKSIVHVIDDRNITPSITINVRRLNIPSPEQFTISSSQIIEDFIVRNIRDDDPDKMFFVYTGRHLNRSRSFADQFVENDSELFCLHQERDEVKGEKRQKYRKTIKQEAVEKQKPVLQVQQKQQFQQTDQGLESYLPKASTPPQPEGSANSQANQVQQVAPNFKKKNITKEINLSSNELNIRQAPQSQENLSIMVQNNLVEQKSHTNSQFFNEGSSISQIVPQEGHNPQNGKKHEEGSMFQSAFMGFNNENSILNQNLGQSSKVNSGNPLQQQDLSQQSQRNSFSFDVRAPQLINLPTNDRHLTLIERQILQVTESEQLSRDNIKESIEKSKQGSQLKKKYEKERDSSIENCHFELGQIENHQLSASAEEKVIFNQKEQLSRPSLKSHEILIQDQDNESMAHCEEAKKPDLMPINQDFKFEEQRSNVECQQQNHVGKLEQQNKQIAQKKPAKQHTKSQESRQSDIKMEEPQQLDCITPKFQHCPQNNIDIYFIEQENEGARQIQEDELQVQYQKFQCQTNGPSSNSNFQSKSSSRVKNTPFQPNQYQFGEYQKNFNAAGRRSGFNEIKPVQSQGFFYEKSRSQISKIQESEKSSRMEEDFKGSNRQDSSLHIVELSLDYRAKKQSSLKLDQYNQIQELIPNENKVEKQETLKAFSRKNSRIEELNYLISDLQEHRIKSNDDLLISQSEISHRQFQNSNIQNGSPEKKDELVGNSHISELKVETSLAQDNNQNISSKNSESEQSLQRIEIKKTVNSYQSQFNFLEHDARQNHSKQNFNNGTLIFRNEPNYFQPLQFYASLFERDLGFKVETTN